MDEMFEYLVPLKGMFKKQRDPKIIESYKSLDDFDAMVDDFKMAESFWNDEVRIGKSYIYRKNKVTVWSIKDIVKASFRVCGGEDVDECGVISVNFIDGSEERLYKSYETNPETARGVFSLLNEAGIKTVIVDTM